MCQFFVEVANEGGAMYAYNCTHIIQKLSIFIFFLHMTTIRIFKLSIIKLSYPWLIMLICPTLLSKEGDQQSQFPNNQ